MRQTLLLLCCLLASATILRAQCPGCVVTLPDNLPADTIYLDNPADATLGTFYDEDVSFRMPMSTTPVAAVDTAVTPGINLLTITVDGISNLPPGVDFEVSQTEFQVSDGETDGCVKLCGTPQTTGLFIIQVELTASIGITSQSTSFGIELQVNPPVSDTDGFTIANNIGCGSATVDFTNNVPSNGNPGFSYLWDFGDGTLTTDEDPGSKTYTQPGVYTVNYTATIDTFPSFLSEVTVNSVTCGDLIGAPDLTLTVRNADNEILFEGDEFPDTDPPVTWTPNVLLTPGTYSLEVRDDDVVGSEDCGTITFAFDANDTFVNGGLSVSVVTTKPVITVESSATVTVFEQPDPPAFGSATAIQTCPEQPVFFEVPVEPGDFQWFFNNDPIPGATSNVLEATVEGVYAVQFTSTDGCSAISGTQELIFLTPPPSPEFEVDDNLLFLLNEENFDENFTFQWFQNGDPIDGATDSRYCIEQTASYSLEVTDPATGCTNRFDFPIGILFQQGVACSTPTVEVLENVNWSVYPNPVRDRLFLTLPVEVDFDELRVVDAAGRLVYRGPVVPKLRTADWAAGLYLVQLVGPQGLTTRRVVK